MKAASCLSKKALPFSSLSSIVLWHEGGKANGTHCLYDYEDKPVDDDDFAKAKPFKEVFPEQCAEWVASGRAPIPVNRGGRPRVDQPKVHIGFRLARDVVDGIRATGKDYNARVETLLREALKAGQL